VSTSKDRCPEWKPPGKLKQYCVFAALLPVYIPFLVLVALWTLIRGKPIEI
jgi:hypothetical protein